MRMGMRFLLAFTLVVLAAIASFLIVARQTATFQVRSFVSRGGMMGIETLAADLEQFYRQSSSWQGAEAVLSTYRYGRGRGGMMGQAGMMGSLRLRLADIDGMVLADNQEEPRGAITASEKAVAIALKDAQGDVAGYLLAEGGSSPEAEQQLLAGLVQAGWIAAAIAGLIATLVAVLLSIRLVRPVEELTRAVSQMAGGDLSQRVRVSSDDELGTLGRSFNRMAESLERAEQNRRAMTADIAHELRTPIAIQRAHLEALQDGVYPLTTENLQIVLDQTALLTRLVEDLRTLALADAGELKLERTPVYLPNLARKVVERFRPEAESRQILLGFEVKGDRWPDVNVDAGRVEQIINNLVSNALRYTPPGGTVRVTVEQPDGEAPEIMHAGQQARQAVIYVDDTGPGITEEDLPRLFERFFRGDKSRSRDVGGTGLGLAIARQLALAHGGDLRAVNRSEGGAEFILLLPIE